MNARTLPTKDDLSALPYHENVVAYLRRTEPELWRWAASAESEQQYLDELHNSLLKECYRLDAEGHPELNKATLEAAQRLGIDAQITLYQAPSHQVLNAAMYYVPNEAHVVFSGPVLNTLSSDELQAVVAHELAHFRLWEQAGRAYLVADRILNAAAGDPRAAIAHQQTAQRLRLYTEIYADRGALVGSGSLDVSVAALVKMNTGIAQVSAASYLRQAEELFAKGERSTRQTDHPEAFIRARALRLWAEGDASLDDWLKTQIEGELSIDELDVFGQERLSALTRELVCGALAPRWMQSTAMLAHARSFFPDISLGGGLSEEFAARLAPLNRATRDYLCYVLLDFARADREMDDLPLAQVLSVGESLGLSDRLEPLAQKELGLNKRQFSKLKKESPAMLEKAART